MKYLEKINRFNLTPKDLLKNRDNFGLKKLIQNNKSYRKIIFPPKEIENELNITRISKKWKIPFNLSEEEFENLSDIVLKDKKSTKIIFDELLRLNPELKIFSNFPFKSKKFMYPQAGVIGGCCSMMNISDIKDYLTNLTEVLLMPRENNGEYKFNRNKEYNNLYNKLFKNKIYLSWFPSIQTMKLILDQCCK